jgi:PAS domain S-box-containing protein
MNQSQPSFDLESLNRYIQLLEGIIDTTHTLIVVVNTNLEYLYFNKAVELYTGKSKKEVLGKNMFEVFPHLREAGIEAYIKKALEGEEVKEAPAESLLTNDRFFESTFMPLRNADGKVEGVIIKVQDRTKNVLAEKELKAANQLLSAQNKELQRQTMLIEKLLDSTVDVIAVLDRDLKYISINQKAIEMYGFRKEAVIGKSITEVFPSLKNSSMYSDLQKALKGEFVYDLTFTSLVLKETHFENYYVPLLDDTNEVYGVMIIGHDITQLVSANAKLKSANEILEEKNSELERSNQELEQFAYVASHDLQEPIRKIATYANKLLTRSKDQFSEETVTYLKRINNSTKRMYELINGLLLYSRITRHNNLFEKISLDQVLKETLVDYELRIQERKIAIQYSKLPEIEAVHVQMVQMFSNLIGNSFKFAKKDTPPVIQIAASDLNDEQKGFYKLDPHVRYLNIFYIDNGIGFDQKYADKIFDLFQRLHDRHEYEGSGLGLSICKKIVANHHGYIFAFSEEGKGATFQIILPYSQRQFMPRVK